VPDDALPGRARRYAPFERGFAYAELPLASLAFPARRGWHCYILRRKTPLQRRARVPRLQPYHLPPADRVPQAAVRGRADKDGAPRQGLCLIRQFLGLERKPIIRTRSVPQLAHSRACAKRTSFLDSLKRHNYSRSKEGGRESRRSSPLFGRVGRIESVVPLRSSDGMLNVGTE